MYRLKNVFVANIALLILCFCSALAFAQQTNTENPKFNRRHPLLLLVKIYSNGTLSLNNESEDGVDALRQRLQNVFAARLKYGVYTDEMRDRNDVAEVERIEKTVWISPALDLSNETITSVVESVKLAGASPVIILTKDAVYQSLLDEPLYKPAPVPETATVKRKARVRSKKP